VFRDITELRHVQRELEEANLHLRSVQDMKNELVSFVAHDIKNPLSIIVATCGLLDRANQLSPEQQEDVDGIRAAAHRINRMVLDMIDLQLAEDGALQLNVQTIEVRDLMQEVARSLIVRMGRAHQRLSVGTADGLAIRGDRSLLFRLIINLADNCLKYGPPDGQIRISAWRSTGDRVAIAVSDEGPGVPEHMRDRIFDRYAKGERLDGQRSADSRGLGLRFCSVMAEAHGGTVWVEDAEPHGARFCVALPAG